jgi:hypothetical protein|tara:strand:- start:2345 stop:2689 length:345 start_codon:yes stop_codon:yes gene_type:complete
MKKARPSKNPKHLAYVRSLPCSICKAGFLSHHRTVQAHHLLKPWIGTRGMSMKADDRNVIPLCLHHHHLLHSKYGSEKALFTKYGMQENFAKIYAQELWENKESLLHIDDDLPF